ncbi:MAG: DUF3516 domain-containing protein, partial [Actinomycetaceae bacterium]
AEGFIDYDDAVVYPFGYGLSYTDFSWQVADRSLGDVDGEISIDVEVTNDGTTAGKDVVELYYSAPYTPGGIEKPEVVLGAFAKTGEIAPGESETVTVSLRVEDMASYDYEDAAAYVLEAGDYDLSLRTDSHTPADGVDAITYTVDETVVYGEDNQRSSDEAAVTNQFDDVSEMFTDEPEEGRILNMSRADFAGTFPTAPSDDLMQATDEIAEGFAPYDAEAAQDPDAEAPTTGQDTDLTLVNLRGLPIDDPQWDELLDSLTIDEMTEMLLNGAYQTGALPSIAKPITTDLDGPAGFSSFINASVNGTAYPTEFLIAQTWNVELSRAMGTMVGNEALFKDVSGWYAPAVNLHRSPFAGRNFEYYSEDPFLSGAMGLASTEGAASKGVYTALKHFALNDMEANRVNNGIAVWANEQTIREVYLKPFEMIVKDAEMPVEYIADENGTVEETTVGTTAVMSSFNRIGATWAGGSEALMTDVLRGEWGFDGFAISDFNLYRYMNPNQSIAAGTDLTLTFAPSKSFDDTSSATAQQDIRKATHHVLYAVANSNAMNGFAPGSTVSYEPPMWRWIQLAATILVGVLVLLGVALVSRRVRGPRAGDDEAKKKRIQRKKPEPGLVNWTQKTFDRLVEAQPERLTSQLQVNHTMILSLLARPGDPVAAAYRLLTDNHEPETPRNMHLRRAIEIYRSLRMAGVVEHADAAWRRAHPGEPYVRLTLDLPKNFALTAPLAPFALAAIDLLDVEDELHALDVVSVVEATLENPRPVLYAQQRAARGEAIAAMKAEGLDYDQRMEALEEVTWPRPLDEILTAALATYRQTNPWVADLEVAPKSVVREMVEGAMTFSELVSRYDLGRSEGVVLRYLTDAYRALRQVVPDAHRTEAVTEIVDWLGAMVRAVDSSLLDEWTALADGSVDPGDAQAAAHAVGGLEEPRLGADAEGNVALTRNTHAFRAAVLRATTAYVRQIANDAPEALARLAAGSGWVPDGGAPLARSAPVSEEDWTRVLDDFYDAHEWLSTGPDATSRTVVTVTVGPDDADLELAGVDPGAAPEPEDRRWWLVTQRLVDENEDLDWALTGVVDLAVSDEAGRVILTVVRVAAG